MMSHEARGYYRRHLTRLEDLAVELDDNVSHTIRHLLKDDLDGSEGARGHLVAARAALTVAATSLEAAVGEFADEPALRVVS